MISKIIFGILFIAVIVIIYLYFSGNSTHLDSLKSGKKSVVVPSSKLSSNAKSNNYSYSIWFYVQDWQYRLSESKDILITGSSNSNFNPKITFTPYENNINISVSTYPTSSSHSSTSSSHSSKSSSHSSKSSSHKPTNTECTIRNFPLQRWVNLIISLNGRTLDVYLDGKLVRTCILPGVAKPSGNSNVNITPNGGFAGWTSKMQYWSNSLNPEEAYNIYKQGYGGSTLGSLFDKYKIKISYLVDNTEEGSFSI